MSTLVHERPTPVAAKEEKLMIVDCDVHPYMKKPDELFEFLPQRWVEHSKTIGGRSTNLFAGGPAFPRITPGSGMRADSWPKDGSRPGSDLPMMQEQLMDHYGISHAILMPLTPGAHERNPDYAIVLSTAWNDWQLAYWSDRDPRMKAGIALTIEDPEPAIKELEKRAGDRRFSHVMIPPRCVEPLGHRRYRKILEACAANNMPIALHLGGDSGRPPTGLGWPSFYHEEHQTYAHTKEALVTSLIFNGVFEEIPNLKMALVEGGFAWVPALSWRMDKHYKTMKSEVPHLKMLPSEYLKRNLWFTTQPIEEPERRNDMLSLIEWVGIDKIMFSSDYPHWDHDDPRYAFKVRLSDEQRRKIFRDNAVALYGLD
jgi:predicted TIM-barrel fold metal-dependent hydrolase